MNLKPGLYQGLALVLCFVVAACTVPSTALAPTAAPTAAPAPVLGSVPASAETPGKTEEHFIRPEMIKPPSEYPVGGNSSLVPPELPSTKQLMGLTRHRLVDILGLPSFRRRDISVEIWQYRDDICILDIFLYRQKDGESFHVKHIEARDRSVARIGLDDCYLGLIQKHSKKNSRP